MIGTLRRAIGRDLAAAVAADAEANGLRGEIPDAAPVTETELAGLPEPVRRYLQFMGVTGRARDGAFGAELAGRFRMRPAQSFMPFQACQYNTRFPVARLFHMRIDFAGFLPMIGRDAYVDGHGRMRGKLLGVVPVADGQGDEFDLGELVTWLNDAILLCPSMLLDPATTWSEVDANSFDVSFTDSGTTVKARVLVDERGAPRDFSTTDRYASLPEGLVRAKWTTPIERWDEARPRPVPGPARATWHLADGPFTYIEAGFVPGTITYNAEARNTAHRVRGLGAATGPGRHARTLAHGAAEAAPHSRRCRRRLLRAPRQLRWGVTDAKSHRTMPGDELVGVFHSQPRAP